MVASTSKALRMCTNRTSLLYAAVCLHYIMHGKYLLADVTYFMHTATHRLIVAECKNVLVLLCSGQDGRFLIANNFKTAMSTKMIFHMCYTTGHSLHMNIFSSYITDRKY